MPEAVFLDTNGWIALLNADDQYHRQAAECLREIGSLSRPLLTSDWVLAETGNGLARVAARARFAHAVARFTNSPHSDLVRIDAPLFDDALAMYDRMADKAWGLVDCASFLMMRRYGIRDALTVDRHFAHAGFRCLLGEDAA